MSAGNLRPNDSIAKLDYPQTDEQTALLHNHQDTSNDSPAPSPVLSAGYVPFFEALAEGVRDRDRQEFRRESLRYISFAWAVVCTYVSYILSTLNRRESSLPGETQAPFLHYHHPWLYVH